MLGKWPNPNKLSGKVAPAGGLWIRRVLVRAQEGQLKSAGELTFVSQPADFRFVCCSSVPTPVAECPPHTSKPRPNSGESYRRLGPVQCLMLVVKLCRSSQEWRDRLQWVKLVRDEQPVMSVHLIVRPTHQDRASAAQQSEAS